VLFVNGIVAIDYSLLFFTKPKQHHKKGKQNKKRDRVLEEGKKLSI
tara:strand:+ start:105 stop:242 length:138 start_codon:yes stop_codon:yes gene_type:complete